MNEKAKKNLVGATGDRTGDLPVMHNFMFYFLFVALSNYPVKTKPSTVKLPVQINGLSNQRMSVLSEYG